MKLVWFSLTVKYSEANHLIISPVGMKGQFNKAVRQYQIFNKHASGNNKSRQNDSLSYHDGCLYYKVSLMSCKNVILLKVQKSDWSGTSYVELKQFGKTKFPVKNLAIKWSNAWSEQSAHTIICVPVILITWNGYNHSTTVSAV